MIKTTICLFILSFSCLMHAQWDVLPDRMWEDSLHRPFIHGVASGDPTLESVILWTRYDGNQGETAMIELMVSENEDFSTITFTENYLVDESTDFTLKTDVTGLNANTFYYYKFMDTEGNESATGRTKTAPSGSEQSDLKIAVASCSSIYSGYFNAYARMAERVDIDLVIHLGDYIYDFVDEDEQVRVPEPHPIDPQTKEEFWQRHRYYLLDPDLRAVRQNHPIAAIWDNHDIFQGNEEDLTGSIQAFFDYLPARKPDLDNNRRIYRSLDYGDLLSITLIDIELLREQEFIDGTEEISLLSNSQYDWLTDELLASDATWRIIGNQKVFSNWAVDHVEVDIGLGNGFVADPNAWDGFPAERERLLTFLRENDIENNIIISGDIHLGLAADLVIDPKDESEYDPETGEGAIGVEFVMNSVSRGNLDELLDIEPSPAIGDIVINISNEGNPHHKYLEMFSHGYGLLEINQDSVIASYIFSDKLEFTSEDVIAKSLVIREGENHWANESGNPTSSLQINVAELQIEGPFPNPSKEYAQFILDGVDYSDLVFNIIDTKGKLINSHSFEIFDEKKISIPIHYLDAGTYYIEVITEDGKISKKLIKI